MYRIDLKGKKITNFLLFMLPILIFIGFSIQFMALDVDGTALVEDQRLYSEYMSDWWSLYGLNRILGQGAVFALYKLPGILTVYKFAPMLALLSRFLFILAALSIMRCNARDYFWLIGLGLVTPFWLDPALLFNRAVYELMSVLVFFFIFRKAQDNIGVGRVFAFAVCQVLFYEAALIPGLALIWFVRRRERKSLYVASGLFAVLYISIIRLGLLTNPKLLSPSNPDVVTIVSNGVPHFMPLVGKFTQFINSMQAATPLIVFIALVASSILAYLVTVYLQAANLNAPADVSKHKITVTQWMEFLLAFSAPVGVNWIVSYAIGNHGRVYWMMLSYSWLLFVLQCYYWSLHTYMEKTFIYLISACFLISTVLVIELHIDLVNHDMVGFSGRFFRGFTSHFGLF